MLGTSSGQPSWALPGAGSFPDSTAASVLGPVSSLCSWSCGQQGSPSGASLLQSCWPELRRTRALRLSSSMGLDRSLTSTWRFRANEVALLTRPSISAPLKFLVLSAHARWAHRACRACGLCRGCSWQADGRSEAVNGAVQPCVQAVQLVSRGCWLAQQCSCAPASTSRSTSAARKELVDILLVWICTRQRLEPD